MNDKNVKTLKQEYGENFVVSRGALWRKLEPLNEPNIDGTQIKTFVVNGREVSYYDGHPEIPYIYVRTKDKATSYAIHKTITTRDTPQKYGGYKKGQIGVGLYPA